MQLVSFEHTHLDELADHNCPATILMEKEEAMKPIVGRTVLSTDGLMELADFTAAYPDIWKTVRTKIDQPNASYSALAECLNIGKSTVRDHLKFAAETIPEISKALLIDTRFKRKGVA